jgi:hypothetical protein
MQIFLPDIDIEDEKSPYTPIAKILDSKRVFKQVVEASQVINIIESNKTSGGFVNHPVVNMWRPYLNSLKLYHNTMLEECKSNRGVDTKMTSFEIKEKIIHPWFLTYKPLLYSHRRMLKIKDPNYYKNLSFPDEYLTIGYIWIRKPKEFYDITTDLALLADPLAEHYIQPRYCSGILKSGKNKGCSCGKLISDKKIYCGIHNNLLIQAVNEASLTDLQNVSNDTNMNIIIQRELVINLYKKAKYL